MRIAVDTNRYRDSCAGLPEAVDQLATASTICMPFVQLPELREGFACGHASLKNESTLTRFLNRPRVRVLFADEETTRHYARVYLQLRTQGTPILVNDMWIPALVLQHSLLLCSRDRHFDCLPQLPRI